MKIGKKKEAILSEDTTYEDVMALAEGKESEAEARIDQALEEAELTKKAAKMEFDDLEHACKWLAEQLELKPAKKGIKVGGKKDEEEESEMPTWKEVHAMDSDDLGKLCEAAELDISDESFESLEEAQDFVCKKLKITEEKKGGGLKIGGKKDKEEEAERPSWKEISKMDADDLAATATKFKLDVDKSYGSLEEAQKDVAKQLGVKAGGLAGLK